MAEFNLVVDFLTAAFADAAAFFVEAILTFFLAVLRAFDCLVTSLCALLNADLAFDVAETARRLVGLVAASLEAALTAFFFALAVAIFFSPNKNKS